MIVFFNIMLYNYFCNYYIGAHTHSERIYMLSYITRETPQYVCIISGILAVVYMILIANKRSK